MSDPVFGAAYAAAYDVFYADKNYAAECDLLEDMFAKHASSPVRRVLDLGCGTGRHSCLLAGRGYDVVGVDRSEDMLIAARERAAGLPATFVQGDIRDVCLSSTFDAALMMFAVLGYQTSDADLTAALRSVRQHLSPGGILIFDVWYGPAVLAQAPEPRWRFYETPTGGIVRHARGTLSAERPVCAVDIQLWSIEPGSADVRYETERHEMRYFAQDDLRQALSTAGCELVALVAFPAADRPPDESTWNVLAVALAV